MLLRNGRDARVCVLRGAWAVVGCFLSAFWWAYVRSGMGLNGCGIGLASGLFGVGKFILDKMDALFSVSWRGGREGCVW